MLLESFDPVTAAWFRRRFEAPTPVQARAWPAIAAGGHALIAAPTGSGKTLAALLWSIDALVREGRERGLPDETRVLYVSPLRALSNDVQKNLVIPLEGIREELAARQLPDVEIRAWVRTGDTPAGERERMRRKPPHILVTTPESLYILLTSDGGRRMLATVRTVIVDEIHALAPNKRGAHLALSLERLTALAVRPPVRIGLSATQHPLEDVARFLVGDRPDGCAIVDEGYSRERDLALELPRSPLAPVMANEVWAEIYDRLAELIRAHRTTLVFVNTRRHAERVARHLAERLGEESVTAHHGSLARAHRLAAEQRLKRGELKALVATASLELGIDIGEVDLVCQLGTPRAIGTFLQRVGRSGHAVGALPKGRLFPLTRDDLVECVALLDAVRRGELDRLRIAGPALDVLAQQIVAEVACGEQDEQVLYDTFRRAWPYHALTRASFEDVVRMLAEGFTTRRGRRGAWLHHDAVHGKLRARRGAKLVAVTNGGAIPDQFEYEVVLAPEGARVGTLNEDFAFESIPGDVFQLGNTSYRILKIEQGKVYVEDARGMPPNMPFWLGEAPGRSDELSAAVARLRAALDERLAQGTAAAREWAEHELALAPEAAVQLVEYLAAARLALGALPTQTRVIFERFFDEAGDQHLVIHSPFGSRLNRAWGLALRKRFCRAFNFELQAAALEDTIVLSLGPTHSFALEDVARWLHPASARHVLVQALLAAPMFGTRWRWNATVSLAVQRNRNGRRVPAQFQRSDSEDLLALVFPEQLACAENLAGEIEVPDHPLVEQTITDCLHEAMDVAGFERLMARLQAGEIEVLARDLAGPSPLAQEILSARPYAFLDDTPAEERRTLAVRTRGTNELADAAALATLDPAAIARVRAEAWPDARNADELHDALVVLGFLTAEEGGRGPLAEVGSEAGSADAAGAVAGAQPMPSDWRSFFAELCAAARATEVALPQGQRLWVAAERLEEVLTVCPAAVPTPDIVPVRNPDGPPVRDEALRELVRSRLEGLGPMTAEALAAPLGLAVADVEAALLALQHEGFVMQGRYTPDARSDAGSAEQDMQHPPVEWCERRLLARINHYTVRKLRAEIEPVSAVDYLRFLIGWHRLDARRSQGEAALDDALARLEGFPVPAAAWEREILPARVAGYLPLMLDRLCATGRLTWARFARPKPPRDAAAGRHAAPVRATPIVLAARGNLAYWRRFAPAEYDDVRLGAEAERVREALRQHGASFFNDLVEATGLLRSQVEAALAELVAQGLVTCDTFAGLRALTAAPERWRRGASVRDRYRQRRLAGFDVDEAGRWSLVRARVAAIDSDTRDTAFDDEALWHIAGVLLRRWGIVFRRLLEREPALPPWRDLLYVYRRMEARGEVRGGRFVQGFSGEQFAHPDAVGALRAVRRAERQGELVSVSAVDPLNLLGIVTPGPRVPALAANRILYRDGVPVAVRIAGEVYFLTAIEPAEEWALRSSLLRNSPAIALGDVS
ncbi:MAG TPA: DEAD/DEAH box helicase [Gammaproteobacteria bacterium]|nr:DEAD/DEAH box helicase [Gammaproteobacteria bacterium]